MVEIYANDKQIERFHSFFDLITPETKLIYKKDARSKLREPLPKSEMFTACVSGIFLAENRHGLVIFYLLLK